MELFYYNAGCGTTGMEGSNSNLQNFAISLANAHHSIIRCASSTANKRTVSAKLLFSTSSFLISSFCSSSSGDARIIDTCSKSK